MWFVARGFANRKVLVNGGAGSIGSHICGELLKQGAHVIAIDDMSAGRETNVPIFEDYPNYRFKRGRVCESDTKMHELSGAAILRSNTTQNQWATS